MALTAQRAAWRLRRLSVRELSSSSGETPITYGASTSDFEALIEENLVGAAWERGCCALMLSLARSPYLQRFCSVPPSLVTWSGPAQAERPAQPVPPTPLSSRRTRLPTGGVRTSRPSAC